MGKPPFEFKEQKKVNKVEQPAVDPEKILRAEAIHRLEGTPPYEPIESMLLEYPSLGQQRHFRGLTKREYAVIEIFKTLVLSQTQGTLLSDDLVKSLARQALVMSEGIFQTLAHARGLDIQQMKNEILSQRNASGDTPRVS